jgi:pantoate--beta-alanine ligase
MQIFSSIPHYQQWRAAIPVDQQIGLVPTMGALHQGHLSLVREARKQNHHTVVSIFVNPTQFGPSEDFESYPRTWESDLALLEAEGVAAIFAPSPAEIYPNKQALEISFQVKSLDKVLCGVSRPGHMNGVLQVVSILFHILQPSRAYFGEKDYQQFLLIRQMTRELHIPLEVMPCPIVREADGLALSSRNVYLSETERPQALALSHVLQRTRSLVQEGESLEAVLLAAHKFLSDYPLVRLDYLEILNQENLLPPDSLSPSEHPRAFIAAFLGKTRLIDNLSLYP